MLQVAVTMHDVILNTIVWRHSLSNCSNFGDTRYSVIAKSTERVNCCKLAGASIGSIVVSRVQTLYFLSWKFGILP